MPLQLAPGTKLGSILIEAPSGSDELGARYTATIEPVRLRSLVHVLREDLSRDAAFLKDLQDTLQRYAAGRNAHLAQIVALNQTAAMGRWLLVTSIGNGRFLRDRWEKKDLTAPAIVAIFHQILLAVQGAHDMGIMHGELCLDNILIGNEGRVKVLGFAFAGVSAERRKENKEFTAPELLQNSASTIAGDIYALGVVLQKLFLSIGIARIPQEIRRITDRMTTQDLNVRFKSAAEISKILDVGKTDDAHAEAERVITRNFERTKTIELEVEQEVQKAKFRERLPSKFTVVLVAAAVYLFYAKALPHLRGMTVAEVFGKATQIAKTVSGVEKATEMKQAAMDAKTAVEASVDRTMASADSAADSADATPGAEKPKN